MRKHVVESRNPLVTAIGGLVIVVSIPCAAYADQSTNSANFDRVVRNDRNRCQDGRVPTRLVYSSPMKRPDCRTVRSDYKTVHLLDSGEEVESCSYSPEEVEQMKSVQNGESCDSPRAGDGFPVARSYKVKIMGDGKTFNAKGEIDPEDDRRFCNANDLACAASGTLWCEDNVGNLIQAGSATVVDGEMKYDPQTRQFKYVKWSKPSQGAVRFIATGHNYYDARKFDPDKNNTQDIQHFNGNCYFYPKGKAPANFKKTHNKQEVVFKKNLRPDENKYRAKIIFRKENWKVGDNRNGEWSWGVLERDITSKKAPIINLPRETLQSLADNGANIKQYGWVKWFGMLGVASTGTKLYASQNQSYVNSRLPNTVLDCNDTNGGASGGASTISVQDGSGKWHEAVYAVRVGAKAYDGKEQPHGNICDPTIWANVARLVNGDFYNSLITGK